MFDYGILKTKQNLILCVDFELEYNKTRSISPGIFLMEHNYLSEIFVASDNKLN